MIFFFLAVEETKQETTSLDSTVNDEAAALFLFPSRAEEPSFFMRAGETKLMLPCVC